MAPLAPGTASLELGKVLLALLPSGTVLLASGTVLQVSGTVLLASGTVLVALLATGTALVASGPSDMVLEVALGTASEVVLAVSLEAL